MFVPELCASTVKPVLQDWTLPPLELWAMFPTGHRTTAKARAFISFIEPQLSQDGAGRFGALDTERSETHSGFSPMRDNAGSCDSSGRSARLPAE
jgi:hypothetical protein